MSETKLPDDHEFSFEASVWNRPDGKPTSLILYHPSQEDYVEIEFDQFDAFIAYLQKVRAEA